MTYAVKDWKKFQHFKDRRPPWIKLYRDILDDIQWHQLDPVAAKALVMIWLIASEHEGRLPPTKELAFRLRMTEKQTKSIVSSLSHWLEQDDINAISDIKAISPGYPDVYVSDYQERETEREGETEAEGETDSGGKPPANPLNLASWKSYKQAYCARYGVDPVQNAKSNSIFKQLVERLGPEAVDIAAHYVRSNNVYYVRDKHTPGPMLKDAEGLRTEWATGNSVTHTQALQADQTAARGNVWGKLIKASEEKERNEHSPA